MIENGKTLYDFSTLSLFWVGTGLVSALFCFTTAAIVAATRDRTSDLIFIITL